MLFRSSLKGKHLENLKKVGGGRDEDVIDDEDNEEEEDNENNQDIEYTPSPKIEILNDKEIQEDIEEKK